jgi:hypothetical protein
MITERLGTISVVDLRKFMFAYLIDSIDEAKLPVLFKRHYDKHKIFFSTLYVQSQVVPVFLSGTKKGSKGNKLKMIRLA